MKFLFDKTNAPLVSIIILNFNGKNMLIDCLQSILNFTEYPSYEILVVDNASIDGSVDEVKKVFGDIEKLKVIVLNENFGYSEGNNRGYANISEKSKYALILNNDVILYENDWLRTLVEFMENHEDAGAASPFLIDPKDNQKKLYGYHMDVFGEFFRIRDIFTYSDLNSQQGYNECFSVLGATIIVRTKLVEKIGLFNSRFFLDYEDADFCWRLRLFGYKVFTVHSSKVYHLGRATVDKYTRSPILLFHRYKNRIYMLLVNYELTNVIRYVPWVVLSYVYENIKEFARVLISQFKGIGDKDAVARTLARPRGLAYVLVNLPYIWKDRSFVQENIRVINDSAIIGKYIIPRHPVLAYRAKPVSKP